MGVFLSNNSNLIVGLACALNIAWIIILYFQGWLLLRSFFFFAVIFGIGLYVVFSNTFMRSGEILLCSFLAALRGLLAEIYILILYVFMFFEAHLEVPEVWIRSVLPDLGVFLGLMVLAAVIGSFKGSSDQNRYRRQIEVFEM